MGARGGYVCGMDEKSYFGEWEGRAPGEVSLTAVIETQTLPLRENRMVAFRIAMVTDENQLADIRAGRKTPPSLQLSFTAAHARRFASQLELAADIAEGRVPRPNG